VTDTSRLLSNRDLIAKGGKTCLNEALGEDSILKCCPDWLIGPNIADIRVIRFQGESYPVRAVWGWRDGSSGERPPVAEECRVQIGAVLDTIRKLNWRARGEAFAAKEDRPVWAFNGFVELTQEVYIAFQPNKKLRARQVRTVRDYGTKFPGNCGDAVAVLIPVIPTCRVIIHFDRSLPVDAHTEPECGKIVYRF
jgi:hypothetical protein